MDTTKRRGSAVIGAVVLALMVGAFVFGYVARSPAVPPSSTGSATALPAPAVDEAVPAGPGTETAVLAGGCFWGVQGVFQHVNGVTEALSGYAGGAADTATYPSVGTGTTGHAESVRVTYDPRLVTYGQLLRVFFAVAHNPTELDRQGPDAGTQYRSAIFPQNAEQKRIAEAYIAQLDQARAFDRPIVTRTDPAPAGFFPAERYHQDYLNSNPSAPYVAINDLPKVRGLQRLFPELYRDRPVLVLASR